MEKKYILTDETITLNSGVVLHRIKAIRSFKYVNEGDLGGWIEKEDNLSHDGDCWVSCNAIVCNNAKVFGNAGVFAHAIVCDNAKVFGNAGVFVQAIVCDNAQIFDNAAVYGHAVIYDNAKIFGNAGVYDNARVHDDAVLFGYGKLCDNAQIFGNTVVCDNGIVNGNARIYGNAVIQSSKDCIVFKEWWSCDGYFTWTRSNNMWHLTWFYGTGDELVEKAYKRSEISGREFERVVKYVESILKEEKNTNFFKKLLHMSKKSCTFAKNLKKLIFNK